MRSVPIAVPVLGEKGQEKNVVGGVHCAVRASVQHYLLLPVALHARQDCSATVQTVVIQ
jgi:hypothetical protein